MKNISGQYQDLLEGRMTQSQFLRNARMMFPSFVTNHNSFEDSVTILKQKGMLTEGDAVKGVPNKAPEYDYPTQPGKYKKVEQSPEVDEQDGIYPATTLTDIPKEKVSKRVVSKTRPDGLEDVKDKDTKNEMKKVRVVKEALYKGATDEIRPKGNLNDKMIATLFDDGKIKLDVKETGTGFNLRSTSPAAVSSEEFTPMFVLKTYSTIYEPTEQDKADIKAFVNKVKGVKEGVLSEVTADTADIERAIKEKKIDPSKVKAAAEKAMRGDSTDLALLMAFGGKVKPLEETYLNEVRISPDNRINYLANALGHVWNMGTGRNTIDYNDMAQSLISDLFDDNLEENQKSFDDVLKDFLETDDATEIKAYIKDKGKEAIKNIKEKLPKIQAKGRELLMKYIKESLQETKSTPPSLEERLKPLIAKLVQEVKAERK